MLKKLIIMSSLSLSIFAYAKYVVIIDSETNNYNNSAYTDVVSYSDWAFSSYQNCYFDKLESDVYLNKDFVQTEYCEYEEERTKTTVRTYTTGEEEVLTSTEYQITEEDVTVNTLSLTGTHVEESCSDILSNGYSDGNGYYTLSINEKSPNVYCNMTDYDGGWTFYLITNTNDDWKSVDWNTGITPDPSLNLSDYDDLKNICLENYGLPVFADYTSSSYNYWYVARDFLNTETNFFDFHNSPGNVGDGAGIALGLEYVDSEWKTLEGTETSLIPADTSNSDDYCDQNLTVCGFWDIRDYHSSYGYGAGPEDWNFHSTEGVICGGKW